ncbi:MAG TPA: hypothetical protein DCY42_07110 [Chloroflexi bacterium]|nr:hypothetical protein [Chloroflexota bacterium]
MQILSTLFLYLIMPISLAIYWLILRKNRARLWFLLLFSYFFYFLADSRYILLLLGLSLLNYLIAGKRIYWIGIIVNLLSLTAFKFWGTSFGPLIEILKSLNMGFDPSSLGLAVPLGLSYYVFKYTSYLVDVNKKRYPACQDWVAFFTYGAFFAEISAGPISTFDKISQQLAKLPKHLSNEFALNGLLHLSIGIGKKVLLVENLSRMLRLDIYVAEGPENGLLNIWLLIFLQGLFLYLDFSSYSDIALGLGYLFGLNLPENFKSPYISKNPSQFWQRWHITLSNWFRVYVFSPLSRLLLSRLGSSWRFASQVIANLVTMTLVGLWHGIDTQFVLWGFFHGILLSLHAWSVQKRFRWVDTWIDQVATLAAIFAGWVFFFSTSFINLTFKLRSIFGYYGWGKINSMLADIPHELYVPLLIMLPIVFSNYAEASSLVQLPFKSKAMVVLAGIVLATALLLLGNPGDFTYVQF